jgi:hypothetical protein
LQESANFKGDLQKTINNLLFGAGSNGNYEFFNGTIDEVKIYNRALSEEEIKAEYDPKQSNYRAVLEYNKIYIQGIDRFGKGSHKVCIEKVGNYLNKPLVKITKCG